MKIKRKELIEASKLSVAFVDEMLRNSMNNSPSIPKPVFFKKSPTCGDYCIEDFVILKALHEFRKLHSRDMNREIARKIKTSSPTSEIDFGFIKITVDIDGLKKAIQKELK